MKAVVTVKVKAGYLSFPFVGPVELTDIEKSHVVATDSYGFQNKVGEAVVELLREEEVPT